ncbi:MAG: disulfide bond formation protein B [Pseudomonadota bacterium]
MARSKPMTDIYPAGPNQGRVAIAVAVASILVLAIAWGFELIGGFVPCKLCLMQREGYYAAVPLLLLSALGARFGWPACATRGFLLLAGLMLATSLTTAVYQAGAEWRWWLGPNDCGTSGLPSVSAGSLLDEISETTIIFCDEAAGRFLGLSFAGWNVPAAGSLALACLIGSAWASGRKKA